MSDLSLSGVCMLAALTVTMWPSQGYWQQWQQPLYSANPMPQQTGMWVWVCVCGVCVCGCVGGIYHHVCEDVEQKVRSMRGCGCVWVCGWVGGWVVYTIMCVRM